LPAVLHRARSPNSDRFQLQTAIENVKISLSGKSVNQDLAEWILRDTLNMLVSSPQEPTEMALSIHDNRLVSYEVQCEARTILLRTEYRVKNQSTEFINVIFRGLEGYRFENDAFGNIILGLETVALEQFLAEYGAEISKAYNAAGSPGPWAANLETASRYLRENAIEGFILSSSFGLSGWILAREMSIFSAPPGVSVETK
jgi:hypothetical protein